MEFNIKNDNHFDNHLHAFLNSNNEVIGVYNIDDCNNEDLIKHIFNILNADKQVSLCDSQYDGSYPISVGYVYENDMFYSNSPYPSWTKSKTSPIWEPPVPMPTEKNDSDGNILEYSWNESIKSWDVKILEFVVQDEKTS
jgi:hypothetical protein